MKKSMMIRALVLLSMGGMFAPGMAAGDKLPKVLVLDTLSKVYEPVRFNHEGHVSMVGGCADCHHQHRSLQIKTCSECHRFDPASFRKNVLVDRLLPCRDCHPKTEKSGTDGVPALKAAYHQACLKCHWEEVGSAGKNLEACAEACHVPKSGASKGAR